MKFLIVLSFVVATSFLSYASNSAPTPEGGTGVPVVQPTETPQVTDADFWCHFEGGRKGLQCQAQGEFCLAFVPNGRGVSEPPCGEGDTDESEFRIVCSDGYTDLAHARGSVEEGIFTIESVPPGNHIRGTLVLGADDSEATLRREDGTRLEGSCELRSERFIFGR